MACALIFGGRDRTVAAAWQTLNANGGPLLWGSVFAGTAAALVIATFVSGQAMMFALWIAAMPYALLGWWFFRVAAFVDDSASYVGAILCFRAAIMHISRGDAYRVGPRGASSA